MSHILAVGESDGWEHNTGIVVGRRDQIANHQWSVQLVAQRQLIEIEIVLFILQAADLVMGYVASCGDLLGCMLRQVFPSKSYWNA